MHTAALTRQSGAPALRVATGGAIGLLAILALLHVVKPEMEPSWRFVSEYAVGRLGWLMTLGFLAWAASCLALSIAARPVMTNARGRAGTWILAIVGVALVLAGIFPQDPVTSTPDQATTAGMMHAVASMIGIPGIPIAAMLISSGLPADGGNRGVRLAAHATWISLALMVAYLAFAVPRAGGFNPSVYAGFMNRLVVLAYIAWQLVLARRLERSVA
jgi:hypothetical membrane protein